MKKNLNRPCAMDNRTTFWHNRNVLVTGAAGLLGPWLIDELLTNNAHIVALVRDRVPDSLLFTSGLDQRITIVSGDLLDPALLARILNECDIDTVFHLGAQAIVGYANRSPISTFRSNIEGTWNLLEACRHAPWVKRIIVASSDKAYGVHDTLPYTEDAPLQGRYPYDVSKSCADLLAQSYAHTYRLPVGVTRCGNFFGGGDLHFNRIVPGTIRSVLAGEPPIIRSNGKFIRDYIYVKDVADAYLTLAEQLEEIRETCHPGEGRDPGLRQKPTSFQDKPELSPCFNFSTDTPFTVLEIVNTILRLMNAQHLTPVVQNNATNEIPAQHLSSAKAHSVLSWQPTYGVERGLIETIAWYEKHLEIHEKTIHRDRVLQRSQEHC